MLRSSVLLLATISQQVLSKPRQRSILSPQLFLRPLNSVSTMAEKFVKDKIASDKVVVFSKSYCPFCSMAKKSLTDVGLKNFTVIEIEDRGDCQAIQDVLSTMTGARSVPRVFIGGKFVGGGTEVQEMQRNGRLAKLLKEVGAL